MSFARNVCMILPWSGTDPEPAPGRQAARAVLGALLLPGCLAAEMRTESAKIDRAREGLAADREAGWTPEAPAADGWAEDLESRLASGPSICLVQEAAVRRNPDLKAALERWVAFLERVPQRTALPYPSFRFAYSSMFLMNTFEGMQEVPFPAKLLSEGQAALAEARAMGAEFRERRNVLREKAAMAYAELYLLRREIEIIDSNLSLLGRFIEAARTKYAAGTVTQSDVLRAEVERSALRAERAQVARGAEVATSALNVLLDRSPDAPIGPLEALPEPGPSAAGDLFERALERRPELDAAAERVASADAMAARARQEWIPDLTFGGAYVRDFGMDENEVELTAGITLPIWWGAIRARKAEAEAEALRARAEAHAARNRVLDEVKSAAARLAAASERYEILAKEAVPRAAENVQVSEAAYTAGKLDFLSLIDSERMLLMRQLEMERAIAEHASRKAELERAVGGEEEP
jgi:outer membrane protein TolC